MLTNLDSIHERPVWFYHAAFHVTLSVLALSDGTVSIIKTNQSAKLQVCKQNKFIQFNFIIPTSNFHWHIQLLYTFITLWWGSSEFHTSNFQLSFHTYNFHNRSQTVSLWAGSQSPDLFAYRHLVMEGSRDAVVDKLCAYLDTVSVHNTLQSFCIFLIVL